MPIFSRRRIQSLLDDLGSFDESKHNDLLARLSSQKPEHVIAAEMELALLTGIAKVSDLTIEPELPGTRRKPEAFSKGLFNKPAYIEVTTLSDNTFSGEDIMNRASHKIVEFVNTIQKNYGSYLFFNFQEKTAWQNGVFSRDRCITKSFELDDDLKEKIREWASSRSSQSLRLTSEHIDVIIETRNTLQKQGFNFFSSMPSVAYTLEGNPLFNALKKKKSQLSAVPEGALKVIFIADGGSRLLRLLDEKDPQYLQKSGSEIIRFFLQRSSIDLVCVFSVFRGNFLGRQNEALKWRVTPFFKSHSGVPVNSLEKIARFLPVPNFEGYQARTIHKQGLYEPGENSWYLGTVVTSGERITLKISARLLQEYLAGKITKEKFENEASMFNENVFSLCLRKGHTISEVCLESGGLDKDDDYVKFEFQSNPSASSFK